MSGSTSALGAEESMKENPMKFIKTSSHCWFVLACLAAIAGIVACNLWSLLVGDCVIHDFLRIPTIGWWLILANVAAGLILYFVRRGNRSTLDKHFCTKCCTDLRDKWGYCPNCGSEVTRSLHSRIVL